MKVTSALSSLPPVMEFLGGIAMAGGALVRQPRDRAGPADDRRLRVVHRGAVPVLRAGQEAQPRQRQPAAGDCRRRPHLRDARHALRGASSAPARCRWRRSRAASRSGTSASTTRTATAGASCATCSFEVPVGQMVAIVGLSGAGKTTLVNLIPRFYDVTGGAILIDGVDIRDVTIASLRAQIGMVTQDTVLFDDTVAANIAYGSPGASKERIEAAARAAHAHEFVATLPDGYETRIGERGQRLSGGQRQRLAIARALLKDPPILDPRRGHLVARRRVGAPGAGRAAAPDGEPHVVRHRAPPLDGAPRRCDRRARARRGARGRPPRRAAGAAERRLRAALRAADVRERGGGSAVQPRARSRARRLPRPPRPTPPRAFHDHVDDRVCQRHARGGERDDQRHGQERQPSLPRRAAARAVDRSPPPRTRCARRSSSGWRAAASRSPSPCSPRRATTPIVELDEAFAGPRRARRSSGRASSAW